MGQIVHILSEGRHDPAALPYAERVVIEDCVGETVHVHVGNIRTEYSREQFLAMADRMTEAAARMREILAAE